MKVLQVCHKMPYPPLDGGSQVMHFTTLGLLHHKIDLQVLAINPTRLFVDTGTLPGDYVRATNFRAVTVDTKIKPLHLLLNFFKKESYFTERFESEGFEAALKELLLSSDFDIIQLEHIYLCKYLPVMRAHSSAHIILRPQNVEYVIWERFLKGLSNPVKRWFFSVAIRRLKKFEMETAACLDGILALTDEDAALFSGFGKMPVWVVPMGYDYEKLRNFDFEKQYKSVPIVYHLASMDWMPNQEAVRWFLSRVLPHLSARHDALKIIIAGRKMPEWVYKYQSPWLQVVDEVKDPVQFQEDKAIMIVPLLSGSGIRAKIIEGLALGRTIISTSIGAQGIRYENGKNMFVADNEKEFADLILKCVSDPETCRNIGRNAKQLGEDSYHYKATARQIIECYSQLLNHA